MHNSRCIFVHHVLRHRTHRQRGEDRTEYYSSSTTTEQMNTYKYTPYEYAASIITFLENVHGYVLLVVIYGSACCCALAERERERHRTPPFKKLRGHSILLPRHRLQNFGDITHQLGTFLLPVPLYYRCYASPGGVRRVSNCYHQQQQSTRSPHSSSSSSSSKY